MNFTAEPFRGVFRAAGQAGLGCVAHAGEWTGAATVRDAIELSGSAKLSFWDALVIVAAARSGAKRIYTEDLQHGQTILGVEIVNPFREN